MSQLWYSIPTEARLSFGRIRSIEELQHEEIQRLQTLLQSANQRINDLKDLVDNLTFELEAKYEEE